MILGSTVVSAQGSSPDLSGYITNLTNMLKDLGNSLCVLFLVIQGIRYLVESDPFKRSEIKTQFYVIVVALGLINLADVIVSQIIAAT